MRIEVLPVASIDPQVEALAQAEAREWALGVQVVAQTARLRLAAEAIEALRLFDHARTDAALAAWYAVPGDVAPLTSGDGADTVEVRSQATACGPHPCNPAGVGSGLFASVSFA